MLTQFHPRGSLGSSAGCASTLGKAAYDVRFGLGDLFIGPDGRNVRMVITPDCDIVVEGWKATRKPLVDGRRHDTWHG